ncbi:uncharacterized protein BO66DRAFT_386968 [Aspergillus aculeatinus CBS 121060]|uniref:Uncharacterized protein n=1 Tax=Aspergillus aculeatinus CBS 121060 TaxID=1448322 RepID=A0ACD1GRB1_9EURO|nr:hypothetical protein BO66DRAFT_386968 [Aspergillus aculeatinus CBS 121060]RAH63753.1 hypothetical protein BO66DRAFT_386968 [Aspergillus aculeatinus CBS 121060]
MLQKAASYTTRLAWSTYRSQYPKYLLSVTILKLDPYLEQKLSRLPEDRVRELLIRSGHHRLLGLSGDVDGALPSKSGVSGPPGVHLIDPCIKRYIDEEIHNSLKLQQDIVRDSIKSELDDIVQDSIRSELPGLVDHFREEIADEHKIKVCELGEVVQDNKQAVEAKKALKEMALKLAASLRASSDDLQGSRHEEQGTHARCRSV